MDTSIYYTLIHPDETPGDFSPFQGFSPGVLETFHLIKTILTLPPNFSEAHSTRSQALTLRCLGWSRYQIIPLQLHTLRALPISINQPFWCLLSTDSTARSVANFIDTHTHPIFHISTTEISGSYQADKVTRKDMYRHLSQTLAYIDSLQPTPQIRFMKRFSRKFKVWPIRAVESPLTGHNCTLPNELALRSLSYIGNTQNQLPEPSTPPNRIEQYTKAVLLSAKAVQKLRNKSEEPSSYPTDYILALPSMYRFIYVNLPFFRKVDDGDMDVVAARSAFRALKKQTGYNIDLDPNSTTHFITPTFQLMLQLRASELQSFTMALAGRAASELVNVIRLPLGMNKVHGELIDLGNCARGQSLRTTTARRAQKLARLFSDVSLKMSEALPVDFKPILDKPTGHIKLVSDTPLEWMQVRGAPLMLRHDVSRIPSTPGNVFAMQVLDSRILNLRPDDLKEVLVIRSFEKEDPILPIIERALSNPIPGRMKLSIKIIDVHTEEDIVNELNNFEGCIVIFDCHGAHDQRQDVGAIMINGKRLEVWNLRGKVRVPPIILLSACDTHPIDRSHASTANAFLMMGAKTVLATLLPINANYAALFIWRLLFRISECVPIVTDEMDRNIRWTHVVSGLIRRQYVYEVTKGLIRCGAPIDDEQAIEIGITVGNRIDPWREDWYETLIEELALKSGWSMEEVVRMIRQQVGFVDSLKYVQFGNPEQVVILSRTSAEQYEKAKVAIESGG